MKRGLGRWSVVAVAAALMALLAPTFAGAGDEAQAERRTLVGLVEIAEESPAGEPQRLALVAGDARYLLTPDAKAAELQKFIGQKVRIEGSLSASDHGQQQLTIRSFDVVEG